MPIGDCSTVAGCDLGWWIDTKKRTAKGFSLTPLSIHSGANIRLDC